MLIFVIKLILERKHRGFVSEFSETKVAGMREQLHLQGLQLRKKDTRIEYLEKAKKRAAAS